MRSLELRPDIQALLVDADGPEPYTLRLIGQLDPVREELTRPPSVCSEEDAVEIRWMVMELASNAVASALGHAVGSASGLPRASILDVLGTSAVWPGPEELWRPCGTPVAFRKVSDALGMDPADWLRLPVMEKFMAVGLDIEERWVRITCRFDVRGPEIDIAVSSDFPPMEGDMEEISSRLSDPADSAVRIAETREPFRDEDGMFHMPSFTGGGGMGLVECCRIAGEIGLSLDLVPPSDDEKVVTLRLHGVPRSTAGE